MGARHTQPLNVYSYWSIASLPGSSAQLFFTCLFYVRKSWEVEPGNEANWSTQRSIRTRVINSHLQDGYIGNQKSLAETYPVLLDSADWKEHE